MDGPPQTNLPAWASDASVEARRKVVVCEPGGNWTAALIASMQATDELTIVTRKSPAHVLELVRRGRIAATVWEATPVRAKVVAEALSQAAAWGSPSLVVGPPSLRNVEFFFRELGALHVETRSDHAQSLLAMLRRAAMQHHAAETPAAD